MTTDNRNPQEKGRFYLLVWLVGVLTQILLGLPLVFRKIHWRALLAATLCFVPFMFMIESFALAREWWIWNPSRILGPKIGQVPLEEFLIYFLCVPSLAVFQAGWECLWEHWLSNQNP